MSDRAARHLSEAIQIPTISSLEGYDCAPFFKFHAWLEQAYPLCHKAMERRIIGECALLYRWPGQDSSLPAAVFLAHMDVVPAEGTWEHPPFSGAREGGFIHGRGTLDMKGQLVSLFEAAEALLEEGVTPKRDLYFSLGSDEELMRDTSARDAAEYFRAQNIPILYAMDEGILPPGATLGFTKPVLGLSGAEKGYLDLKLIADGQGGHASAPPKETPLGRIAAAIVALEQNPMPSRFGEDAFTAALQSAATAHKPAGMSEQAFFESNPKLNALYRTTIAPTMAAGSPQSNVLPLEASVTLNIRIAPWETSAAVLAHIRALVPDLRLEILHCNEPIPPADPAGMPYRLAMRAAERAFPEAAILPWCMTGATDSRYFAALTRDVLRFTPFPHADAACMHAPDERILEADLAGAIAFFRGLFLEDMEG